MANPHETRTQRLEASLAAGEKIHWQGRPRQGFRIGKLEVMGLILGVLVGAIAASMLELMLEKGRESGDSPTIGLIAVMPFFLLAAYAALLRPFLDRARRRRTRYAVTDSRVLFVLPGRRTVSLELHAFRGIARIEHGDGRGTLVFVGAPFLQTNASGLVTVPRPAAFEDIDEVGKVHDLISSLRQAQPSSSALRDL